MTQDPTSIGRYQVLSLLGRGGMGAVYLVEDPKLKRQLVIKVVHEGGRHYAHAMERFQREAEISARLNHPNIITVHDVGEDPISGPYIAMEYVKGTSLAGLIHDQASPPEALLHVLTQASRGLMAAAMAGIAHRDVKPENILVGSDGRVKLTDFGVARSQESQHLTTFGGIIGTPSYFAPELLQDAEASPITDCYALAVTAFEAFTGVLPFQGDSVASTLLRIVNEPPAIPPSMDPRLKTVFLRAFAKRPRDRFPDVYGFMGALVDAVPIAESTKAKMHAAMEGTEVSMPGLSASGVFVPTPRRTNAPQVPQASQAPPTSMGVSAPLPNLPRPAPPEPAHPVEPPRAPRVSRISTAPPPKRNAQAFGLLFAGVGALLMSGAGFLGWRWWKAQARPIQTTLTAATDSPSSSGGPATGRATTQAPASSASGTSTPPVAVGQTSTPSPSLDTAASKPTLTQLQQQLKDLKERNAREAEQLRLIKGGAKPTAAPAQDTSRQAVSPAPPPEQVKPETAVAIALVRAPAPESLTLALARVVTKASANFPRRARELRFETDKDHIVRLRITVDEQGRAADVAVLEGISGIYGFNEEAIAAAKRSSYLPATRGGKAQRESLEITYLFKAGK